MQAQNVEATTGRGRVLGLAQSGAATVPDFIVVGIAVVLYWAPTIVAWKRKHHNAVAIALLNLFFGWTIIVWIAALIWSATSSSERQAD
jgi:Superinfection immunity protein